MFFKDSLHPVLYALLSTKHNDISRTNSEIRAAISPIFLDSNSEKIDLVDYRNARGFYYKANTFKKLLHYILRKNSEKRSYNKTTKSRKTKKETTSKITINVYNGNLPFKWGIFNQLDDSDQKHWKTVENMFRLMKKKKIETLSEASKKRLDYTKAALQTLYELENMSYGRPIIEESKLLKEKIDDGFFEGLDLDLDDNDEIDDETKRSQLLLVEKKMKDLDISNRKKEQNAKFVKDMTNRFNDLCSSYKVTGISGKLSAPNAKKLNITSGRGEITASVFSDLYRKITGKPLNKKSMILSEYVIDKSELEPIDPFDL